MNTATIPQQQRVVVLSEVELDLIVQRSVTSAIEQYIAKSSEPKEDPEEVLTYEQVAKIRGLHIKTVGKKVTELGIPWIQCGQARGIRRKFIERLPKH